jgi:hypothetical protein
MVWFGICVRFWLGLEPSLLSIRLTDSRVKQGYATWREIGTRSISVHKQADMCDPAVKALQGLATHVST